MSVRALVLNDTRRGSFTRHLGCVAVMDHLLQLCRRHGIEVIRTLQRVDGADTAEFRALLPQVDAVLVNGEGTMHHDTPAALALSRAVIEAKSQGKKTALLNALWQDNRKANACVGSLDCVWARDSLSAQQLRDAGARDVQIAPDLSLFHGIAETEHKPITARTAALVVDSVDEAVARQLQNYADVHGLPFRVMQDWRIREDDEKHPLASVEVLALSDLVETEVLISGRFHAVCFALKLGRPFLATTSNSHKVEALLHDAGVPPEEFILPPGWEHQPAQHWIETAKTAWARHSSRLKVFAAEAADAIERAFAVLAESVGAGAKTSVVAASAAQLPLRRRVRICYFNTWAQGLEKAADYVARVPALDLKPLVANPRDATLLAKARLDCDWYGENTRCFAALNHEAVEFLPAWVSGVAGVLELARAPREPREERWLITMGHQPQSLGAAAGRAFALLAREGVRHLFYAFDEASRFMPCFAEIAPHLDVLIHDEFPLDEKGRARLPAKCITQHRSWVANVVPFAVPFEEKPASKIIFLGSQLGMTPHRERQIAFLTQKFPEAFFASRDHSVAVSDRGALNRSKVGFCPEGRRFTTPAMSGTHTDRPFWSGCFGMVPVCEDSKSGGRLQELHEQKLILRYAHGDLSALAEACEQALAMSDPERRRIYEHFNRHETVGTVVASAIASVAALL
jgi:hypothetical protein